MADNDSLRAHPLPQLSTGPHALYYPHIHFRSRRWLRVAPLYYERLSRIVPSGFDPEQPELYAADAITDPGLADDVRELRSLGFISDEPPSRVLTDASNEFFDFYAANLRDPQRRALLVPALNRLTSYTIHPDKIDPALLSVLEQAKDAHRKEGDSYSDWRIDPVVGAFYMLFLARHMAGQRPLVSDNSTYQSLLFRKMDTNSDDAQDKSDRPFRLAATVIQTSIPADIEAVPLDKLLRFRADSVEDRQRFQDKIASHANDLAKAVTEEQVDQIVARLGREMDDEQSVVAGKLRSLNLTTASALFGLSLPSYATATWGFGIASPIAIGGLAAVAVSGIVMRHAIERRIARTSPYNYLLNVGGALSPNWLAKDIVTLSLDGDDGDGRIELSDRR